MDQDEQELLIRLSRVVDIDEAESVIKDLEHQHLYTWRPVGDNEANYGLINIGSDPGHALIERITNAIDAVIEREAATALARVAECPPPQGKQSSFGLTCPEDAWLTSVTPPSANLLRTTLSSRC